MFINLPEKVKFIIERLAQYGFDAYAVGGCVRDSILNKKPNDWDICTDALPKQTKAVFSECRQIDSGIKHGTIAVIIDDDIFEITTYRIDGEYSDNRHPDKVTFTNLLESDLARRDFTVNSMAYNDKNGLIDPFGGLKDLQNKLIKCVGIPDTRFNEDALRIMRALRFASGFNFLIDTDTQKSIFKNKNLLKNIAVERINAEFTKLLVSISASRIIQDYRDVIAVFIPEISVMFDYDQHTMHHNLDLWRHSLKAMSIAPQTPLLRMTMLLHDIGKPYTCTTDADGNRHFRGHAKQSAAIAERILKRLRYSSDFINTCVLLIFWHDIPLNGSKKQLRRLLSKIGDENMRLLFKVQLSDKNAQSDYMHAEKLEILQEAVRAFEDIIEENECFSLKDLAVNGNDLIKVGVKQGKEVGKILNMLLNEVIDEKLKNEKDALLEKVKSYIKQNAEV